MGPHAREARRAARDRARSQHARAGAPAGARSRVSARSSRASPTIRAPSRRSARPRSSSASRSPPGPTSVGDAAARNLLDLQDSLPPLPFEAIRAEIEASFGQPLEALFASDRSGRGRLGLDRAGPQGRDHRRAHRRDQGAASGHPPALRASDIETYEWAAAHLEALGGEAARLRPRLTIENFRRWTVQRARSAARGGLGQRTRRCDEGLRRLPRSRRSTGTAPTAGC